MSKYIGADNLEVMDEAKNYNSYLITLILKFSKKNNILIDFGAGTGMFAKKIEDFGYKVICIEPDIFLSEKIKEKNLTLLNNISDLKKKAEYIYSLNVLEHIKDDTETIKSIYDALKPGGIVAIYVPAFEILFSNMDKKVGHYRRYEKQKLIEKMQYVGFHIISAQYVDSLGFIATLIYKAINKKDGDISKKSIRFYDKFIFPISKIVDKVISNTFGKNIILYAIKS